MRYSGSRFFKEQNSATKKDSTRDSDIFGYLSSLPSTVRSIPGTYMISSLKRRTSVVLTSNKSVTYGLQGSRRHTRFDAIRPARRQFGTTFLNNGVRSSLRRTYSTPSQAMLKHMHVRAVSYSSIPRFVARAFRVPIAGATIGAGGFGYANYKFEGVWISVFLRTVFQL